MPIFDALRPEGPRDEGFVHAGAGRRRPLREDGAQRHRVRLMQAYAEGYELLDTRKDIVNDVTGTFKAWQRGTVVRSWLLDLLVARARGGPRASSRSSGYVDDSGEGRWTVEEAIDNAVPMPVDLAPRSSPASSRGRTTRPAMKAVAALRNQFGGHAVQGRRGPHAGPTSTRPPQESVTACTSRTCP